MRFKPAGLVAPERAGLAMWLALAASVATGAAALAASGPYGTDISPNEFLLVLDRSVPMEETVQGLAQAGFSRPEVVSGIPARYGIYAILRVTSADAGTKAQLLKVNGILAVRPLFRRAGMDEPLLPIGQVIAKFEPGTTRSTVDSVAAAHHCAVAREIAGLRQAYVFNLLDEATTDSHTIATQVAQHPAVVYSYPSVLMKLQPHQAADEILDPLYPWQWHLNNTGQLEGARPDADIDAPEAWELTLGEGAIVGLIDDSIQRDHEDIVDNYLTGYDFSDQDDDPSPSLFIDAHGVATSGIICARANSIGLRGVAPMAQLIGCRLGGFFWVTDQDIADAFLFCEENGAMAINNSWGPVVGWLPMIPPSTFFLPDVISDAINQIATTGRNGLGVLVLFSSGNSSLPVEYDSFYAAMSTTMAIGATQVDDTLTCYSSYGKLQSVVAPGSGVDGGRDLGGGYFACLIQSIATTDVQAVPGQVDLFGLPILGYNPPMKFLNVIDPNTGLPVYVPDPWAPTEFDNQNYTRRFNGTSAACPVATGVAALVFSVSPDLTAREARNLIEHTADKVNNGVDGPFDDVTGHNSRLGHGRVNAFRAVVAAQNQESWPSPVTDITSEGIHQRVRLLWEFPDWDGDGFADEDVAGVLVVQGPPGQLNWHPTDGVDYTPGEEVAPGVTVVANDLIEVLDLADTPIGQYDYGLFVYNGDAYYSWGRRAGAGTTEAQPGVPDVSASVRATPTTGVVPLAVHFAGGGIALAGASIFEWSFGDGTVGQGATVEHTYATPGTYYARLTARNNTGQVAAATVLIRVLAGDNQLPVVEMSAIPSSGPAPLTVVFEGTATDADGVVVRYDWFFGDGTTDTGPLVEHVFVDPGTYAVVLMVTDDRGGTGSAIKPVFVSGPDDSAQTTGATDGSSTSSFLSLLPANCGAGSAGSAISATALLLGLTFVRRRR